MLQYVGGNFSSGLASGTLSTSLTALSGGIDTQARPGDLVLAFTAEGGISNADCGVSGSDGPTDYTELADLYGDDTLDCNLSVNYKYLTQADPNAIHFGQSTVNYGRACAVHVWRGVEPTTIIDVTSTSGIVTNTGRPQCPAITPLTPGAVTVIAGAGTVRAGAVGMSKFATPANYENAVTVRRSGAVASGSGINLGVFSARWPGYAATSLVVFTSGSSSSADASCAITIALQPVANSADFIENAI